MLAFPTLRRQFSCAKVYWSEKADDILDNVVRFARNILDYSGFSLFEIVKSYPLNPLEDCPQIIDVLNKLLQFCFLRGFYVSEGMAGFEGKA